jgi:chemotaxis protein methyltransferase CheR
MQSLKEQTLRVPAVDESEHSIDPSENALFETRLSPIARLAGGANPGGLMGLLKTGSPAYLHRAVAEAMTVNETSFFRDAQPFELLRQVVLPRLIAQRRETRRLRLWSAASSTGQEAYSMAMLIAEHFPELAQWDVKIIGTDIAREAVEYARRGRYRRLEVNRGLPVRMLVKYLVRDGEEWEVCERIRAACEFQHANLCEPLSQLPEFDLVLLRNVLLYFSPHDRRNLFSEVHRKMMPNGYLMLGNAEQAEDSTSLFEVEFGANCYFYRAVS